MKEIKETYTENGNQTCVDRKKSEFILKLNVSPECKQFSSVNLPQT